MRQMVPFFSLLIILIASTVAFAQRDLKDIPVPDPEEERRTFVVADGFEVNLFAADPLIHKPIQINFDPQGRLWVAASEVYPQIAPGQVANDKILILEDKDGDGVADSTTVFADGLLIPTASCRGTAERTSPTARNCCTCRILTATARPTSPALCCRASALRTPTTSFTRFAGGRMGCSISISPSTSTVMWKRPTV
jgi:hypothetical protein